VISILHLVPYGLGFWKDEDEGFILLKNLNKDIWLLILAYLPNKQVLRCRFVCKSFWKIIKDYPFSLRLQYNFSDTAFQYICTQWQQLNIVQLLLPYPRSVNESFSVITQLRSLKSIRIEQIPDPQLKNISALTRLESLSIDYFPSSKETITIDLYFLAHLTNLSHLSISHCMLRSLTTLNSLKKLSSLQLYNLQNSQTQLQPILDNLGNAKLNIFYPN